MNKNEEREQIVYLLLVLMLCFPQSLMVFKAFCLSILVFYSVLHYFNTPKKIYRKKYIRWFFCYELSCVLALTYGLLRGNPGIQYYYTIYIVWPIVFPIIFSSLKYGSLINIIKIFEKSYIFLLVTGLVTFLKLNFGLFPFYNQEFFGYELDNEARPMFLVVSFSGGAVVQFFVLFCFLFSYYCIKPGVISVMKCLLLVFGILYITLTSRRIMMMGVLYIPFILWISKLFVIGNRKDLTKNIIKVYIIPIILAIVGFGFIFYDFDDAFYFFSSAFSSEGDLGMAENQRLDQYSSLVKGWNSNFYFGAGTGVDAGVSRSPIPGTYELSYMAVLFERGLLGGIFYFVLLSLPVIWALKIAKKCRDDVVKLMLISYNTSYISLLIANATNPYIMAFDFMWIIFLYVVIINIVDYKIVYDRKNLYNNPSI